MNKIIIASDSTCDLPEEYIQSKDIKICPISIIIGDKEYHDRVDITSNEVLKYVNETGTLPKTSATTIQGYKEFFEECVKDGDELIYFCISSKSSSCVNNATKAAEEVKGVYVVDSYSLSSGQGIQIARACDLKEQGLTAKEIVEDIESKKEKVQISFVIDTLDFLHKGGRCSSTSLMVSKVMKIHPSIAMKDGTLSAKKKYIGNMQRCVTQYVIDTALEYKDYDDTRCFITYSPTEKELVDLVESKVIEHFKFKEIIHSDAGSTVTSHCGQNTIGVIFYNK